MDKEMTYTIFARWGQHTEHPGHECWFPPYGKRRTLEESIEYVRNFRGSNRFEPFAWAISDSDDMTCKKSLQDESLAAGRIIEKVGDSYIPRGIPGEEKEKPFRIGSIYRDGKDRLYRLKEASERDQLFWAEEFPGVTIVNSFYIDKLGDEELSTSGHHRLDDGIFLACANDPESTFHLLPGEVDKHGNPVESERMVAGFVLPPVNSGKTLPREFTVYADPNAAMIARDQKAAVKNFINATYVFAQDAPKSTAKPPLPALQILQSTSHQIPHLHGSAMLAKKETS